jgi:hypothetical protein
LKQLPNVESKFLHFSKKKFLLENNKLLLYVSN